jgi:hypothetical protein
MIKRKKYTPPKKGKGDTAHLVVKAGMATIPFGGGAAELFTAIVTPPLERRRQKWMEEMGEGLSKLEEKRGINLEKLRDNEDFIDIVMHASQAAIRNSQAEKRQALRNAVMNAALPEAPEQSIQHIFIDLIDTFTEWHLRILKVLHNPEPYMPDMSLLITQSILCVLTNTYRILVGKLEFVELICRDLNIHGLTRDMNLPVALTEDKLKVSRTTILGKNFLQFITEPTSQRQHYEKFVI